MKNYILIEFVRRSRILLRRQKRINKLRGKISPEQIMFFTMRIAIEYNHNTLELHSKIINNLK